MNKNIKPFEKPLLVTRPLLPDLKNVTQVLKEIWDVKWVTNGGKKMFAAGYSTKLYELEEALRKYLKVPKITVFNNGTTALLVAIREFFKKGEVITTPFTFPATPHALAWNNLSPVFCDINYDTLTLDINKIESLITEKTIGILGVHVYGMPCDVHGINAIAEKYNLKIIYDAAHAFGTEIDGVSIGCFGDISMFSFHAAKLFNTIEGGALTYSDPDLEEKMELYKDFGIRSKEEVVFPGINGKMNEIQAAIGLLNLELLEEERIKRQNIIGTYKQNLSGINGINIFEIPPNIRNSLQYFVIRISNESGVSRDELYQELSKYNVFARKYFYPLCSNYDCYKHLPSASKKDLPKANKATKEVLCLPLYGDLELEKVLRICQIIHQIMD